MERRHFLRSAGVLVAGGTTVLGQTAGAGESAAKQGTGQATVLITSSETPLAQAIAAALGGAHHVRLLDSGDMAGDSSPEFKQRLAEAVRGCDAVICLAAPPEGTQGERLLDYRTRGLYELLGAAARQNVRLAVYAGSLEIMLGYPETLLVDETFRPVPAADAGPLSHYLGEFVCREFARDGKLRCISLRLGRLRQTAGGEPLADDPLAVDLSDAVQAVERALDRGLAQPPRLGTWEVFHIQSAHAGARFGTAKAQRLLGFQPRA